VLLLIRCGAVGKLRFEMSYIFAAFCYLFISVLFNVSLNSVTQYDLRCKHEASFCPAIKKNKT